VSRLFIPAIHLPDGKDLFRPLPYKPAQFKKILKAYGERSLLECRNNDYIVLHKKPQYEYLDFLIGNGIGTPNIIECEGKSPNFAEDILNSKETINRLEEVREEVDEVIFYIHLDEEKDITKALGLKPTMHPDITKMLNRYYFLKRLCEDLDIALPPSRQIRSNRFIGRPEKILKEWGKLFVRGNSSVGGSQVFIIENENDIKEVEKKISRNSIINRYFAMPFIERTESFNVQYKMDEEGYELFGFSRQLLDNGISHNGNEGDGLGLPMKVLDITEKIAERLSQIGARGFIGIDVMQAGSEVFPAEINGRQNTSTPLLSLYNRLSKEFEGLSFKSYQMETEGGIDFAGFVEKVGKKNLFDINEGEGVIPYHLSASRLTGKIDVASFHRTPSCRQGNL